MDRLTEDMQIDLQLQPLSKPDAPAGGYEFHRDFPFEWCWHKDAFTPLELDAIIRIGKNLEMQKGYTGKGDDPELRDSFVSWLFPNEVNLWIFERLHAAISDINQQYFNFDLSGLYQGLQFTKYSAPGQHYTWHTDRGGRGVGVRKLSLTLQLSDPAEYMGGDLQFKFGEEEQTASRDRGMMAIFPSWTLHRVTPVTEGTRYSLVAWVSGPPFK
jgi:PKHD-type hydroxylase